MNQTISQPNHVHPVIFTLHAERRVRQRGLSQRAISMVRSVGEAVDEGYVMTNKAVDARKHALLKEIQELERLRGVAVIEFNGVILTTYRADELRVKRLRTGRIRRVSQDGTRSGDGLENNR